LSLIRHINSAWNILSRELGEYIEVIPAQKRVSDNWYLGTADAIYQNLYSILPEDPKQVIILSGDHIYKMNYRKMLDFHHEVGADVTVAAVETPLLEAGRFGILETAADWRVIGFEEKPRHPRSVPDRPNTALASMGVYIFNTEILKQACCEDAERMTSHDFGKDIIPRQVEAHKVYAYLFRDENKKEAQYWRDVGTVDAYWEANMDLVAVDPVFNLYARDWPLRTLVPMVPPAKFVFADHGARFGVAVDSIVSAGCIVSGGMVNRSVLAPEVRINSYSHVEESILMNGSSVGRYARVRRTIIEKNVHIPSHMVIGYDRESDAARFHVTPKGIVVVEAADVQKLTAVPEAPRAIPADPSLAQRSVP
jgi:glucose-1-phosphate adenylyltransferase